MKKAQISAVYLREICCSKIFKIMRNTLLLLIINVFHIFATNTYSQSIELTMSLKDVTVKEVLTQIEEQSEFYFLYNSKLIDVNRKIDLQIEKQKIDEILDLLFYETRVNYMVFDRQIILSPVEYINSLMGDNQQPVTITGKVTDVEGDPMIGVTVMVKGTSQGTITNSEGIYSLSNVSDDAILRFSFVGYSAQEVEVNNRTKINITLTEDALALDEIVVIGYGTQQRRDITGSVASVSAEELENISSADFTRALAGQMPGVQVIQSTGAPGGGVVIRVRGTGSISAGNDPLYVVDGVPVNNANSSLAQGSGPDQPVNPLSTLNPDDIASLEVLKDASATAIYGSRGSNGVILITTKRGQAGEPTVRYNVTTGLQQVEKKIDLLNEREVAEFWIEARTNSWVDNGGSPDDPFDERPGRYSVPPEYRNPEELGEGTNWQDEIFRTAYMQNHQLSVSGGNKDARYYVSGNFADEQGIIINSGFKRYSFRTNLDAELSDNVRIGLNFNPSFAEHDRVNAEGHFAAFDGGVISTALTMVPSISPQQLPDGTYENMAGFWPAAVGLANPVALTKVKHDLTHLELISNAFAEWDIIDNLTLKTSIGVNVSSFNAESFHPSNISQNNNPAPIIPFGNEGKTELRSWISETTIDYPFNIGDNNSFSLLLGNTIQMNTLDVLQAFASNYPNNLVETVNAGIITDVTSTQNESSLLSYFGRLNYEFDEKYLLTAHLRTDGASNFGEENRWGVFPSLSVGWRISEELFMNTLSTISNLKLKASYGLTGNNSIGNYGAIGLLGITNYVLGESGSVVSGLSPSTFSNPQLGWEKTRELNTGLELGLLENRLFLSAEYYSKLTTDLLLNVNIPTTTGFSSALQNIGEVENKGWEFMLSTHNLTGSFRWETDLNMTFLNNEVLALGPSGDPIISPGGMPSSRTHITQIGQPIGSFFGYVMEGVFVDQDDVDANPQNRFDEARPGDAKFKDMNGDGELTTDDRTVLGNAIPDFTYGINNTFSYANFKLTVLLQGVSGGEILDLKGWIANMASNGNQLQHNWNNRWKSPEEPGNGKVFRAMRDNSNRSTSLSSMDVHDASYLRIRNIRLDYQLPRKLFGGLISNTIAYLSIQNVYTFTKYDKFGYNPETSVNGGNALTPGTDFGGYPLTRVFTIGLNVEF